jgi:hypothetical protein
MYWAYESYCQILHAILYTCIIQFIVCWQFKSEIVAEITTNVMCNTRQILESTKVNTHPSCRCGERNGGSMTTAKTKKKKTSDEDSSDGALSSDQR